MIKYTAAWQLERSLYKVVGCSYCWVYMACLKVKFGGDENLLDVLTQYEILEFTECLLSLRQTSFGLVRFDKANQQIG